MERARVTRIGVVAIGRNEGVRLERCLDSARGEGRSLVYVDSGSVDASVSNARRRGAEVVELSSDVPFTAARARNAGFARLRELDPQAEWVQFVDGDCEIDPAWWATIDRWLPGDDDVAVICGRRRERDPDASIYNRLCDLEWNTPIGSASSCGGDSLMRASAFEAVGGFNPALIAGEEPELCFRLRARGFRIERLDSEMTLHDAAMSHFTQWWLRAMRAGHAYAENFALHGRTPARFRARELTSILFWGLALPAAAVLATPLSPLAPLGALALYLVLFLRIRAGRLAAGASGSDANAFALFTVLGKWAQAAGVAWYLWNRARGQRTSLIEYKGA